MCCCCCCCLPRCSLIFVGAWCLVQSILWLILALIGIALYTCDFTVEFDETNPGYYLYFIYFFNRDCADIPPELDLRKILGRYTTLPPGFTTPGIYTTPDISNITTPFPIPDWPDRFGQVDYTHTLMWLYAGFNGAWAVTCIIVIVAAAMSVRSWFAYLPWILLAAANIVLDVIATINFVIDAINSETVQGLLETVIGLNLADVPPDYIRRFYDHDIFDSIEGLTKIPSVIMLILTSRLGILWLLNVLFLVCVPVSVLRLPNKKGK